MSQNGKAVFFCFEGNTFAINVFHPLEFACLRIQIGIINIPTLVQIAIGIINFWGGKNSFSQANRVQKRVHFDTERQETYLDWT